MGSTPENVGLLTIGMPRFVPCTPLGIKELLVHRGSATARRASVLSSAARRSSAKPMARVCLMHKGNGGDAHRHRLPHVTLLTPLD